MMMVTTNRVANGIFEVFVDGVKTDWEIFNGSVGLSGRGRNVYGVHKAGSDRYTQIGSLAACKRRLARHFAEKGV